MKLFSLFISLIAVIILSGCWDYIPLEKNYSVTIVGIDTDKENPDWYKVSFVGSAQTSKSENSQSTGNPEGDSNQSTGSDNGVFFISGKGPSIFSAHTQGQNRRSKVLSLGTLNIILYSENVAKKGINDSFDFFIRNPQITPNAYILISKGDTGKILTTLAATDTNISIALRDYISTSDYRLKQNVFTIKEVNYNLDSEQKYFVLPCISLDPEYNDISIKNIALFKEDKLIRILSHSEMLSYYMISGLFQHAKYVLDSAHTNGLLEDGTSFELKMDKRKINVSLVENRLVFSIYIKTTAKIESINKNSEIDEEKISNVLKTNISSLLQILQTEPAADPMRFWEYVSSKYPDFYSKTHWEQAFSNAKFDVDIKVNIFSRGDLR
jgi:Ger(x)C family germination protein